jgi:4-amino-4-deoxy-L-arabinose transferase-like glycosyltransferase
VGITHFKGFLFPDEGGYVELGRLAARGQLNISVNGGSGEGLFHEAASIMWPITILFKIFGPHILVAALWAALFGAVTAALVAYLVLRVLGPGWGTAAGITVAAFPSQVLWSSVVLRESMVWAALAGIAIGIALFSRAERWRAMLEATVVTGVCLLGLAYLRSWTFVAAAWATGLAVWLFRPAKPALARALCALLLLVVPVLPGWGPAGSIYIGHNIGVLGYERTVLAKGAASAFVHPKVVHKTSTSGPKTATTTGGATTVTTIPAAFAASEALVVPHGLANDLKALPTGVIAFALRPFPGQFGRGLSYDFAGVEELVYYPLYVLAILGLVAYRRRREVIAFPLLVILSVTAIAAETEGNLGSAFRHRDQLLWAVVFLAALGAHDLYQRWRQRRTASVTAALASGPA